MRLPAVAALIVLVHGLLAAWAWQAGPKERVSPRPVKRVALRLVAPAPPQAAQRPPAVIEADTPRRRTPRPSPSVAPRAEPVSGAVFALPSIGFGAPAAARWMRPPPSIAPPPPAFMAQAQAAREQILDALQRQMSDLPAPAEDGACSVRLEPMTHLACDSESLHEAVSRREEALAGLLQALRSFQPEGAAPRIAYAQGRYLLGP
jgi:hypothetical protein